MAESRSRCGYSPNGSSGPTILAPRRAQRYPDKISFNKTKDVRSNMHAGGRAGPAKATPEMLRLASLVQPKLRHDGMFLVGLDIAGDKLMEMNVFSPGGLGSATSPAW